MRKEERITVYAHKSPAIVNRVYKFINYKKNSIILNFIIKIKKFQQSKQKRIIY